jgi:hypothetical protein
MRRSVTEALKELQQQLWFNPSAHSRKVAAALMEPEGVDLLRRAFLLAKSPQSVDLQPLLAYSARRQNDRTFGQKRRMDPLEIVSADYFTGRINFDADVGAYFPEFSKEEFTRLRRAREKDMEQIRIGRTWEDMQIRIKHETPDAGVPVLLQGDHDQHLYFIRCENTDLIKIGIAWRPAKRMKQIASDLSASFRFNPDKTPLLKLLHIVDCGGRDLESTLHTAFAPFRLSYHGSQTEWFEPHALLRLYIHGLAMGADPYETIPQALMREAGMTYQNPRFKLAL